jgi:hypothetical protein
MFYGRLIGRDFLPLCSDWQVRLCRFRAILTGRPGFAYDTVSLRRIFRDEDGSVG